MKNNAYYWIKTSGIIHKYIPMYRNHSGQWKHETLTDSNYISDYKLKLLYGKDCVVREVDFELDLVEWVQNSYEDLQRLEFFVIESESGSPVVLFGSQAIFYYHTANSWQVNKFDCEKKLSFIEK